MFSTTLRHRPDLLGLIPHLTLHPTLKLHETTLETHDLALPIPPQPTTAAHAQPTHQPFLILTPTSLQTPSLHERIARFSTLTAAPPPTIAFILSSPAAGAADEATIDNNQNTPTNALRALMHLQTILHTLPSPPPTLPIPSLAALLPLLHVYTTPTHLHHQPLPLPHPLPPTQPTQTQILTLHLLPHLTSTSPTHPLSRRDTNILSDLCHSLKEVIEMAGTEGVLGEWFGAREARGMGEFWEGEWILE